MLGRAADTRVDSPLRLMGGITAAFIASPENMASVLHGNYVPPILSVCSIVDIAAPIGFTIRSGFHPAHPLPRPGTFQHIYAEFHPQRSGGTLIPIIIVLLPSIRARKQFGRELQVPIAIV